MPNFSEPVTISFIGVSIALMALIIAIGIFGVKKFK